MLLPTPSAMRGDLSSRPEGLGLFPVRRWRLWLHYGSPVFARGGLRPRSRAFRSANYCEVVRCARMFVLALRAASDCGLLRPLAFGSRPPTARFARSFRSIVAMSPRDSLTIRLKIRGIRLKVTSKKGL